VDAGARSAREQAAAEVDRAVFDVADDAADDAGAVGSARLSYQASVTAGSNACVSQARLRARSTSSPARSTRIAA
jgi:hypothetical protein